MPDQMPTHYIVSMNYSNHGDAFIYESVARKRFEEIAARRQLVRLILVQDGKHIELDRRNGVR